jgi:hypothetical protein
MARFPNATWRGPVPNQTPGGMSAHLGLVLHIQQGTEAGTDAWFHNPSSQVSAHFGNPKQGPLDQWVDTDDRAWAEVGGNPSWVSVENEGSSGDSLTASQIENAAQLLAWLHQIYGVPLQISNDPNTPGLSGHSIGGAAWGGHTDCPGAPILAQRQQITDRAAQIAGTNPPVPTPVEDDDMPDFATGEIKDGFDAVTIICPPPAQTGAWGDVWLSFGSDFGTPHIRVAAYFDGHGWQVFEDVAVPAAGDRVNPFGGPAPHGIQKVSVKRVRTSPTDTAGAIPLGWLVEAAKRTP